MSHPTSHTYSETATIAAVRSYFQFLINLYLPAPAIKQPPPTGWPQITPEAFAPLIKNDTVVSLLAHLPYLSKDDCDFQDLEEIEVAAGRCQFADWRSQIPPSDDSNVEDVRREVGLITEGHVWEQVPPHVFGLTSGGRDKYVMLLDARRGVVYWIDAPDDLIEHYETRSDELAPTKVRPGDEAWEFAADASMWSIESFFEMLKEEFRAMRMVPVRNCQVLDVYTQYIGMEELVPTVQAVFRAHGWPENEDVFEKDPCLAEVERVVEEFFPGEVPFPAP